jgi:predicted choloylglycine hydrolase
MSKHIYYFEEEENEFIKENNLYIDTFENFENSQSTTQGNNSLVSELLKKNSDIINKLYHPKNNEAIYLEILKIL